MSHRILYTRPSITELEVSYATDAARHGWGEHCYDYIQRFERAFADYIGVCFAIATSSCTGALQLGLAALGIGAGDEVVLADSNWIATVAPVVHLGATPIFVDILPDTWCLDPARVEKAISPRTKAIIAVHLYGNLCEMDTLQVVGRRHGIPVIEDAAEAVGSKYRGSPAGSMGSFSVFSFHGSKTLTTGEGGMLLTDDPALYETASTLANHGRARGESRQFWPEVIGYKYKMSNLQAAIGCAQLERIDDLVRRKRSILHKYKSLLADFSELSLNPEPPHVTHGAWMPNVVFDRRTGITRNDLLTAFGEASVDARVFFYPLSSLPMFGGRAANETAADIAERAINLPSYHDMTDDDQERVARVLSNCLERKLG